MGAGCCDNKAFGEPCADCAFDEGAGVAASASESPQSCGSDCGESEEWEPGERAALAFGTLTARSDPGLSDFWAAMSAGHLLTGSSDGRGRAASAAFMREQLQSAVASGGLLGGRFSVALGEWARGSVIVDGGSGGTSGGGPVRVRGRGIVTPVAVCCVDEFEYPSKWDTHQKCGEDACEIGFYFAGHAKYKDGGWCACHCCEFRQYVEFENTTQLRNSKVVYTAATEGAHEDCSFHHEATGTKGSTVPVTTTERGGTPEKKENKPLEGSVVECYGRDAELFGDPDGQDVLPTLCHYKMWDRTSEESAGEYDLEYTFTGRIHDVCRNDIVVAEKEFTLKRSGTVVAGPPAQAHDDFPGGSGPPGRQRGLGFPH